MRKAFLASLILLAFASVALAADAISGKWVWESRGFGFGGGGPGFKTTLTLKAEGTKLTGTITLPSFGGGPPDPNTPPQMEEVPISNGKIEGNNISFEVAREFMGTTRTTKYEGVLSGGELKIKIIQQEVTAKKQ
ncbi:MAG: hypothetical protein K6T61_15215 [Bryobacteraceae bacterium]|nr:hypothetical protein [Bryobacteraceae bacterium]